MLYRPRDPTPYPPHPAVTEPSGDTPDGLYVYAVSENGTLLILADGPHRHPRILGLGRAAVYAGDLEIVGGCVVSLTNLSGTFQCDAPEGLRDVAVALRSAGLQIDAMSVRFFPADGGPPRTLEVTE